MNNQRGVVLITVFIFIVVLSIFSVSALTRSIGESRILQHYTESTQAFWLAEAGVNRALAQLRQNPNLASGTNLFLTSLGTGQYNFDLTKSGSPGVKNYTVTARGCIPDGCDCNVTNCRVIRTLVVGMQQLESAPSNFYSTAVYTSGNVSGGTSANSEITGNLVYAGTNSYDPSKVTGTITQDSNASPLPQLNFDQLRAISQSQLHYNPDSEPGNSWPTSFWYDPPSESNPTGTPNVVFIEGNFSIAGNVTKYGFIIVGGEFTYNAEIAGTSKVVGCIYTRGNFTISGGGNALNVDGGIWAGGSIDMGGNGKVSYNSIYMSAIQATGITTDVQINSWQDENRPYVLNP
jgi:Tfp pilus assembly protein PilX